MRLQRLGFAFVLIPLVAAVGAKAQSLSPQCTDPAIIGPGAVGQDACQKVIDLYSYVNAQLGTLVAGGNPTLGQGGTLGGFGHFALTLRGNAMSAGAPQVNDIQVHAGAAGAPEQIPVRGQFVAFPTADLAVGLFGGFPVGLTRLFGLDLLLTGTYIPTLQSNQLRLESAGSTFHVGYGARLGILQESALVPGLAVSWVRRDLPSLTLDGNANGDSLGLRDYRVTTTAWRVTASKRFAIVGVAAGLGEDRYGADAGVTYNVQGNRPPSGTFPLSTAVTRFMYFGDVSIGLGLLQLVGEVGRVHGGGVTTYNLFSPGASAPRTYYALGIRLGL